jgi:hypothetical protein
MDGKSERVPGKTVRYGIAYMSNSAAQLATARAAVDATKALNNEPGDVWTEEIEEPVEVLLNGVHVQGMWVLNVYQRMHL